MLDLNFMGYFLLFLVELVFLFFLSRKLVDSLARIIYKFTGSHRAVVHTLAVIFLPGTIIHELAHLLFAGIMLVPVGELSIIPEIEEGGVKLGSVQIGKTDPFRRMIIGVAPVLLGMILIFSLFLFVKFGVSPWWQIVLVLYLIFEIGNTMFSSKKDIEGSILFLVLIITLLLAAGTFLYFINPATLQNLWLYIFKLNFEFAANFFKQGSIYLAIPVVLNILIILLTRPFRKGF
ncbi:hypothetical protein HYU95_01105 [Candidatus Daviesbacteria bacterium]|nr:hypothetical protein [Candidatus Daviesbacteria bacterium]